MSDESQSRVMQLLDTVESLQIAITGLCAILFGLIVFPKAELGLVGIGLAGLSVCGGVLLISIGIDRAREMGVINSE